MMRKILYASLLTSVLFVLCLFASNPHVDAATRSPHATCNTPASGATVFLTAHANATAVTADPSRGGVMSATNGDFYNYVWIVTFVGNSNVVYLQSYNTNLYVTADPNHGGAMSANGTTQSTWQRFDWNCWSGNTIDLRAHANSEYVTADLNQGAGIFANSTTVGVWQRFDWQPYGG